ncbi:hypothetical protein Sjap_010296 [Stephania japonica]|uniref:HMA domain-containing protein n=1 Tax=Stephania japonica TaxID=461633 RepID=A0AAP0J951_9MAGN
MVQRTVLKVEISCQKCKKNLLRAVSGLEGVDKVEVDAAKGTLTVTGDADPYKVVVSTRKTNKFAEVVSIGPPPKPDGGGAQKKPEEKKPAPQETKGKKADQDKPPQHIHYLHQGCPVCERTSFYPMMTVRNYPEASCSIL